MKQLPITILADDIKTTKFSDYDDCAITRAVRRAGIDGVHSGFDHIVDLQGNLIAKLESNGISNRVLNMYHHAHPETYSNFNIDDAQEPEDIHTFITLTEDNEDT